MTKFRPCIDLHQGQVKQIVGSTLKDSSASGESSANTRTASEQQQHQQLSTNFSTTKPASDYATLYQNDALTGGHVIMLGPGNVEAATLALQAYPGGLQVGGGINETNCQEWIDKGASHVIITSAVFRDGQVDLERLQKIVSLIGKEKLVLDLSCRRRRRQKPQDNYYYVVTDRWQKFTEYAVTPENLQTLAQYCSEFLVHGVDVEGMQCGILEDLVSLLGEHSPVPVTYAGGVRSLEDLDLVDRLGKGKVDVTVGSALDIFGGSLAYDKVVEWHNNKNNNKSKNSS